MWYALLILLSIIITFLLLNVRIRFILGDGKKLLFVGLGRSGPELDFAHRVGSIKLFGFKLKSFDIDKEKKKKPRKIKEKTRKVKAVKPPKRRKRSPRDFLRLLPRCVGPLWSYLVSVLKAAIVEELEGQVEGGFDRPHLTGAIFGYYQAALAAVPGVVGRVQYIPDWIGPSFSGAARLSVAIPVRKLLIRTAVLMYRLPLRDLLKLAIGKKKGVSDA